MSIGADVDTLSLTFDKLQYIFRGYDQIMESFLGMREAYARGEVSERDFFAAVEEGVMRFSALEFLAIKAIFEIRKASDGGALASRAGHEVAGPAPGRSVASFITAGTLPSAQDISGKPSVGMECPGCGKSQRHHAAFCTSCGRKL